MGNKNKRKLRSYRTSNRWIINSLSIAGGAQTTALTIADGALTGTAQARMIEFTGSITGNQVVTIPLDVENFYILKNSTSGSYTVQFKYVSGSGSTFTFAATNKKTAIVQATANDGTNPDIIEVQTGGDVVDDTSPQLGGNLDVNWFYRYCIYFRTQNIETLFQMEQVM